MLHIVFVCFRTRCATEDEEEIINQEIETVFPNYAEADFGEFIQSATLEQVKKKPQSQTKTVKDVLIEDDLKFIGDMFIDTMYKYSRYKFALKSLQKKILFEKTFC